METAKPDLDSRERIAEFIDAFYNKVLADPRLAPIFLDVAGIDLSTHLGHIRSYWEKFLLGGDDYHRHTMKIHRQLHAKQPLTAEDFERWLTLFLQTLDEGYSGDCALKARKLASNIAANMQRSVSQFPAR